MGGNSKSCSFAIAARGNPIGPTCALSLFLLLSATCLILFSGCSSRKEGGQAPTVTEERPVNAAGKAAGNTTGKTTGNTAPERTITLTPRTEQQAPTNQPVRVVRESRPVMQRDQLLSLRSGVVVGPEDFEIGELQGYSDDENVRAILERIRSFEKGLESASVRVDDINPDWRDQAQRSLEFYLERGNLPTQIRVGEIDIYAPGMARANIRMTGDPGVAFGEIYLEKSGESWLVSDLQLDMKDLTEVPEGRQEPYEPSVYRMMDIP